MFKKLLLIFVILILSIGMASTATADDWIANPNFETGHTPSGSPIYPTTFYDNDNLKMIIGDYAGSGICSGFDWNGSSWVSNSSVVTGIPDVGLQAKPDVFELDGNINIIIGESTTVFNAYTWDGATWNTNATLASGLGGVAVETAPTIYYDDSTLKLISGQNDGTFYGYIWNGTTWNRNDTATVTGLPDVGFSSTPEVYNDQGTLKLISGDLTGRFTGYTWDGSSWNTDNSVVTNLPDVGTDSALDVLVDGISLHAFMGGDNGDLTVYSQWFAPGLLTPTNASTISGTYPPIAYDVTFTWEDTATSYRYQVARDSAFNVLAADGYISTNTITVALTDDYYYWRVAAYDSTLGEQSRYSEVFEFDLNLVSTGITGTVIDGVVYEVTDVGDVAVDDAIVYIYNSTWSGQVITGANGYYQFTDLSNDTYSIQATKQGFVDSSITLVTTTYNETVTENVLIERRSGAGDQYDFHYVKYTVKDIFGTVYTDIDVEVFENGELVSIFTAETGTDGSATFILNRDQEYRLEFENATQGIDEQIIHYPKDDKYNVYVITTTIEPDNQYSSEELETTVSKQTINNTHAYINVTYLDNLAETTGLTIYLNQSTTDDLFNQTVIDSYSGAANNTNVSFVVDNYAGQTYFVNIEITHTTFGDVERTYAVNFDGMADAHGFSQVYIWLAIGGIMFSGMIFKATNARQGAFVVCVVAWVFIILDWFDNLGDKGVLAITAGVTLATILSIAAIMAKGEKEG